MIGATVSSVCAVLINVNMIAQQARPPVIRFTTDDAFDAEAIPPYAGRHEEVYRHIHANLTEHLAQLQRWVRQPSVSAQSRGITEMTQLLAGDLRTLGFKEVAIVPTSGNPGVVGFYNAGAPRTLLVYMMYDVQPEETGWKVPAFDGALIETELGRVLMARGATNQKGPERAFLNAVDSIIKSTGHLPVNLIVVAEGEEELGSANLPEVIQKYETRLKKANGLFFPHNSQDGTGAISLPMGFKGDLGIELEAKGGSHGGPTRAEIHSSLQGVVDSPAWRLIQALATLTTPDGNTILVPGYYDAIRQPTLAEQQLVNGWLKRNAGSEAAMRKASGIERNVDGLSGRALTARYLFFPTMNINGMWTGYIGEGMKTILPHVANARIDSRLVPNQTPDRQFELIRKHLAAKRSAILRSANSLGLRRRRPRWIRRLYRPRSACSTSTVRRRRLRFDPEAAHHLQSLAIGWACRG